MYRRGNVLFLILLAVALFAALSYAVTQSNRSGGNNISEEKLALLASQLTQFATNMESALQRLRLTNGCRIDQISFNHDSDGDGDYTDADDIFNNSSSPEDLRCHIYHPQGGGLAYQTFDPDMFDDADSGQPDYDDRLIPIITGRVSVQEIGIDCSSASCNELMLNTSYLNLNLCEMINSRLGIGSSLVDEAIDGVAGRIEDGFVGSFDYSAGRIIGDQMTALSGKHSGCMGRGFSNGGTYFHVLVPR